MPPPLLHLTNIRLTFSGKPLLESAEIAVSQGERLCLVGRNGSGKSTLLKIAAGEIEADGGRRFMQPNATVRYLPQEPDFSGYKTALDYVAAGLGPNDDEYRARYLLEELGLTGEENPMNLSGGEARRIALARVLAPEPDILLLDEPTNHLDLPTIEWLEKELASLRSAMVLISHDRRFLENLSKGIVWLDRGATRRLDRGFGEFEAWRDIVLEEEERERHKLDRKIVNEEHWVRYGVTARRKRNQKRMANLADLRQSVREARKVTGNVKISVAEGKTSGALIAEAKRIGKDFGGRVIVDDFSIRIARGDRVGVAGPNGSGKTTLIKMLTGTLAPDRGTIRIGASIEMATLDQKRMTLDPATTLADALTGGGSDTLIINGERKHVIGYMKEFLFSPEQARTPVGKLSGGERGRLTLARALALPSNLLVLDEPTNDLDLETLDLLQEMVSDYPGTVIVVSHDRDFLDRVSTSLIAPEGKGQWQEYAGGYSDMVAQRGVAVTSQDVKLLKTPEIHGKGVVAKAPVASAKRRISFKEKHALETLPKRMDELHGVKRGLSAILGDAKLFARDPAAFQKASIALAKADADLAKAEEEWLKLEMLREEVEG